jgi:AcrR family transcriptional regulator
MVLSIGWNSGGEVSDAAEVHPAGHQAVARLVIGLPVLASWNKRNCVPLTIYGTWFRLSSGRDGGRGAVVDVESEPASSASPKRADARRNQQALVEAAAAAFVNSGVDVPVRDIAARAGVGVGTIYRHFPTRADLIVAVYRHQVEACAQAGPTLLESSTTPHVALASWINLFVDFLVTKHGLAQAMQTDRAGFQTLHAYFLDRLVPVCAELLKAAADAGEIRPDTDALELLFGVGNLCIGAENNPRYDARRMVELVISGLRLH